MKRLVVVLLILVGLTVLFGSCGGEEEEAAILAVAFRLDEGSPVMVAYIGDPTEDPFELSRGRYYIEALDGNDVLLSLGAMHLEEGDAVDFPTSFGEAGGVADPERAEPMITLASFLVDLELAELTFWEIVTGGFTESPFDPIVEYDVADVLGLYELYGDIGEQEGAILGALSDIEGRAEVSLGMSYVRSPWMPAPGEFEEVDAAVGDFFQNMLGSRHRQRELIALAMKDDMFRKMPDHLSVAGDDQLSDLDEWRDALKQGKLDHKLPEITAHLKSHFREVRYHLRVKIVDDLWDERLPSFLANVNTSKGPLPTQRTTDLLDKIREWEEYAKLLAEDWRLEGLPPDLVRRGLEEKIKSDLMGRHPEFSSKAIDDLVQYFVNKVAEKLPKLVATPTPTQKATPAATPTPSPTAMPSPTATPTPEATATLAPDTSWVEEWVAVNTDMWLEAGYSGIDVAVYGDDLRQCLIQAVQDGADPDEAKYEVCPPYLFVPITPEPEPTEVPGPEETPTPEPQPTETPQPEPAETPPPELEPTETPASTPEETPTPASTPQGQQVRAEGPWLLYADPDPDCEVRENTMWLVFPSTGGEVSGEGHWKLSCETSCGTVETHQHTKYKGNYSPDSNTLSGTSLMDTTGDYYEVKGEECERRTSTSQSSGSWQATFDGNEVTGDFHLTVQGQ